MSSDSLDRIRRRDALRMLAASSLSFGAAGASTAPLSAHAVGTSLKTIGVLGGLGPQATMDFELRLHLVAQRLIPQHQNSGYPPMIVHYYRHPPILLNDDLTPRLPIEPDPRLLEAAQRVGSWADFLVIPSNTPHLVQDRIEQAANRRVLSMIDVTLDEVRRRGWRRLGVLGFGRPIVYTTRLAALGIEYETVDGDQRRALDDAVMKVMEGRETSASVATARLAVRTLRDRKVDGVILGCTEIPLLLWPAAGERQTASEADLIDPAGLLAEAAIRTAMQPSA